tara:strand:+ start:175 stop:606 length:432 start_codon:yes stop_codon:yes gene_type:complete
MLGSSDNGWIIFVGGAILTYYALTFSLKWMIEYSENKDVEKDQSKSSKFNLPKFKDSGWVLLYVICGWIGLVAMIVFIIEEESTFAFVMLGCSLSCFFGAHVLRLQEKVAFHAEQQTNHAERQTELLEKLSSEKTPIIEDKEK